MSTRHSSPEGDGRAPRPTLADVAERVGMSKSAVSLALNNRPGSRLSQDAVARIHAAARDLKYRPNPAARTLRLGRTGTVGFISDEVTVTRFASAMIRGILDVGDEQERGVLIAETGGHPMQLERALDSMVDRQVDALIFGSLAARLIDVPSAAGTHPNRHRELSQRRGPSVRLPGRGGRRICGCQASPGCRTRRHPRHHR